MENKENYEAKKYRLFFKRLFDLLLSFFGIIILFPVFIIISLAIKATSKGNIIYKQERIGKNYKKFYIYKFRTMRINADKEGLLITVQNDSRITKFGKLIRKSKLDELPQLFNVLFGQMSFVGPRPEVEKYVNLYTDRQKKVLSIKPGITDYASIKYRNENKILEKSENPEITYINEILPSKIEYNLVYIRNMSILKDIVIIFSTIFSLFRSET